jgi:hypothetical protein
MDTRLSVLKRIVTVEAMGIDIPKPPPSPRYAKDHLRETLDTGLRSYQYLTQELGKLYEEQRLDLERLKQDPDPVVPGAGTPLMSEFQRLSKSQELNEAERAFILSAGDALAKVDDQARRTEDLQTVIRAQAREDSQSSSGGDGRRTVSGMAHQDLSGSSRRARSADGRALLEAYTPTYLAYQKALDHFVAEVAKALETPESQLPLGTLVMGRVVKIRLFETYRTMIRGNLGLWQRVAAAGDEPDPVDLSSRVGTHRGEPGEAIHPAAPGQPDPRAKAARTGIGLQVILLPGGTSCPTGNPVAAFWRPSATRPWSVSGEWSQTCRWKPSPSWSS